MNRSPGDSHYRDGKIYIAYEGHLTDPYITSYDVETHKWQGPYKAGHNTLSKNGRKADGHGEPTMQQDDDGYFHITFGGHGGEKEDGLNPLSIDTAHAGGRFIHVVSDKPNDISSFSPKSDVSPFASYAQSVKMPNGDMYFFTRAGTHKSPWIYYKLKKGNTSFEPPVIITWPTPRKDDPILVDMFYIKTFKANDTDIIVTMMNHLCNFKEIHTSKHDDRFNAYYMRLDTTTDTFYNVKDEQLILPTTKATGQKYALVYDSEKAGTIVNDTLGLTLQDGKPAISYEIRHPEPRHWLMATFENGSWKVDQPMPGTTVWTLKDSKGKRIKKIVNLEQLTSDGKKATAAVTYRNAKKETVFAIATSSHNTGVVGQDWQVQTDHLALKGAGMEMEAVLNEKGEGIAVVVNVSKGQTRRLYLWHEGKIRPRKM
jgi:predicted heme/steroid binding protein